MTTEEIKALSVLCRIELDDAQIEELKSDFESILGYIDQLSEVKVPEADPDYVLINRFREDADPDETGMYADVLLNEAPLRKGDFIQVQQILGGSDE